jgi:hypothetical protein
MEVDFDKEIDALLRSSGGGRTITISEFTAPHIDADGLAAFAENALPDAARKGYMTHLADCDRCRKTLSGFIASAEDRHRAADSAIAAEPGMSPLAKNVTTAVPWYKSLFAVRNLAYGMGALIILFTGFIGYILLQGSGDTFTAMSESGAANTAPAASGPMVEDMDTFSSEPANATGMSNASSVAVNDNSAISREQQIGSVSSANAAKNEAAKRSPEDFAAAKPAIVTDGIDAVAAPPFPMAELKEMAKEADRADKARSDDEAAVDKSITLSRQEQLPSAGNVLSTQAGPSRNSQRDNNSLDLNERAKKRSASPAGRSVLGTRSVGGKTFTQRDGAWYDSAYAGQRTTNIRRNSESYRKLDSGLRAIAESLDGVVVTLWKSKAYRIQ